MSFPWGCHVWKVHHNLRTRFYAPQVVIRLQTVSRFVIGLHQNPYFSLPEIVRAVGQATMKNGFQDK